MRLLEIKKRLESVLENSEIKLDVEPAFGGQGYQIRKSNEIFVTLSILSDQSWNKLDFSPIEKIVQDHNAKTARTIILDQNEYPQLNNYVSELNKSLPIFIGIVKGLVEDQNPQDINIKLSSDINTPEKLRKLIEDIEALAKVSNIDGQGVSFKGFDKGSDWLVLSVIGSTTYAAIMASLKLAQEILKTKKEYYNSKTAQLDYRASLAKTDKYTQKGLEEYQKKRTEVQIESGIDEIVEKINSTNGFEKNEVKTKTRKTTDCLIKILSAGNELHVSLNPPKEVIETAGGIISIDYSYLERSKRKSEPKELSTGKTKQVSENQAEDGSAHK